MANILGSTPIQRTPTGWWSFDRAVSGNSGLGIPMTFVELYGFQGIGKTTFSTSIMSVVANHWKKNIIYAPFEDVDNTLMGNILDFHECEREVTLLGSWDMVKKMFPSYKKSKDDKLTDELILDCFIEGVRNLNYCVGVIDSLSAITTIAEAESSVADRNMGRARVISVLSRSVRQAMRMREADPFLTILLTHKTTPMGGGTPTNTGAPTTGGEVKKNISKVRIGLRRINELAFEMDSQKNLYERNAYILEGRVEKNNFGRDDKKFFVAMLGGGGVHQGLTAMYECKKIGIASFGKSITLGKDKFESVAKMVAHAHEGNEEIFQPFIEALKNPTKFGKASADDEEDYIEEPAE